MKNYLGNLGAGKKKKKTKNKKQKTKNGRRKEQEKLHPFTKDRKTLTCGSLVIVTAIFLDFGR